MLTNKPIYQRILAVDDNPDILKIVKYKLEQSGYDVLTANSGAQAKQVIEQFGYPHLAILDINMPVLDGLTLGRQIHEQVDLPIIYLTGLDEEETIITAIEQIAEDYVCKPFSPRELVARVRRVLMRLNDFSHTAQAEQIIDGHLTLNFVQRKIVVGDEEKSLTPIENKLLYILFRNAGRTVQTDFLLRRLWPLEEVYADALRVHIHRLRHKIEQKPSKSMYIQTVRGEGYRFPKV